jgi:hypothetical protein
MKVTECKQGHQWFPLKVTCTWCESKLVAEREDIKIAHHIIRDLPTLMDIIRVRPGRITSEHDHDFITCPCCGKETYIDFGVFTPTSICVRRKKPEED